MALSVGLSPSLSFYLISIIKYTHSLSIVFPCHKAQYRSLTTSVASATSIPGRIIPPHLGDRIGHFNVLTICALLSGTAILALWLPFSLHPSVAGIVVFALVYGFTSGAFVSLMMPCAAKTGTLDTLGQRFGTFQMALAVR